MTEPKLIVHTPVVEKYRKDIFKFLKKAYVIFKYLKIIFICFLGITAKFKRNYLGDAA
jgi:hypothetical protein